MLLRFWRRNVSVLFRVVFVGSWLRDNNNLWRTSNRYNLFILLFLVTLKWLHQRIYYILFAARLFSLRKLRRFALVTFFILSIHLHTPDLFDILSINFQFFFNFI